MTLNSDIAERGVEVLARLGRMRASLTDVGFIANWVHDARNALRARLAGLPTGDLVDRLDKAVALGDATGSRGKYPSNIYNLASEAAAHIQALEHDIASAGALRLRMDAHRLSAIAANERATTAEARVKVLEVDVWNAAIDAAAATAKNDAFPEWRQTILALKRSGVAA